MLDALFIGYAARQNIAAQRAGMAAERAATTATQARSQVELMQMDVERLLMITEALWTMLRDEHGYTDDQLIQKVQEIDMRDGRLDGKVAKQPPSQCPQCGRAMSARRPMCVFCGTASSGDPFQR
jgi:hypothetical protein